MARFNDLNYFTSDEFDNPLLMSQDLVELLDKARELAGVEFGITSSYREGDPKAHGKGLAVDIACAFGGSRWRIVEALMAVGFVRIGIYDHHIHADVGTEEQGFPQNVMWWGKSR